LVGGLKEVKHQPLSGTSLDPNVAMLRDWQSQRLARTYQDLLADEGIVRPKSFWKTSTARTTSASAIDIRADV
jgi:hypothetical protein